MGLKIVDCRTEYVVNPIGIDVRKPRFSWRIESDEADTVQLERRVEVKREDGTVIWDTGAEKNPEMAEVCYEGKKLLPNSRYFWTVTVTDNHGNTASGEENFFETGLFGFDKDAFGGAVWIGPTEYTLSTDVRSVFGIRYRFAMDRGSDRIGFIIGHDDRRIKDRENYFKFEIDASCKPCKLKIFRVGICEDDSETKPLAEVDIRNYDSKEHEEIITSDNLYDTHEIDIQVVGNAAYTLIDGKRVDVTVKKTFFGETEAPRTLNPLGDNDVNTYPRLNKCGFFIPKGQAASIYLMEIRNLRKPYAVVYEDKTEYHITPLQIKDDLSANIISTLDEDAFVTSDVSHTSIPILRREFEIKNKKVKRARLYATARGIYECSINGKKVTDTWFNPGCTQYDRHIMYQTYDITELLSEKGNAIGVILASGWWSDAQTFVLMNYNYYGDRESFLGRIEISYEDGSVQNIVTNTDGWKYYNDGPWTYAGFFHGEHYDATREKNIEGYDTFGFDDEKWQEPSIIEAVPMRKGAVISSGPVSWPEVNVTEPEIIGQIGDGVRISYELTAVSVNEIEKGVYIYDMGVNVAGVPHLLLHGKRGETAVIRYAELLYPDIPEFEGKAMTMMVENLRDADCTDLYTFKSDDKPEEYIPRFTFRGYRYIEIRGVSKKPELSEVKMLVLSSAYDMKSSLETSDALTNKFIDNVRRSQQSNFISIPTDCPQRNERMGWDGDTSIFTRTATFNADVRMFYERWLMAMRDLQEENGKYADIAPVGGGFGGYTYESSALHCTYELYLQYGDLQVIRDNYDSMSRFMKYSAVLWSNGDLAAGFTLGDWLAPEETDLALICHAFYGYNAFVMEKMAQAIGKTEDASNYARLYKELKQSFNEKYFDSTSGRTKDHTQCSYALPLSFKMVDENMVEKVAKRLSEKTRQSGHLVLTGFFGTAPLNPMLTDTGHSDDAYMLMTQTKCPSWLYPVTQGATSIWERWDSFTLEKGFGGHNNMNSFNHYSLGAVLEWFYMYVLGIMRDEDVPGYRHFLVRPYVNPAYKYVRGHFTSPYGIIRAQWQMEEDGKYMYSIEIPAGATATVSLPGVEQTEVGSGRHEYTFYINK